MLIRENGFVNKPYMIHAGILKKMQFNIVIFYHCLTIAQCLAQTESSFLFKPIIPNPQIFQAYEYY